MTKETKSEELDVAEIKVEFDEEDTEPTQKELTTMLMKKQATVMNKIEIIREFMTKTGATIPEVIKSLEVTRKVTKNLFSN
jgi:hypothetical protein